MLRSATQNIYILCITFNDIKDLIIYLIHFKYLAAKTVTYIVEVK